MQVVQETMKTPLLSGTNAPRRPIRIAPHPRLTYEKTGLTSEVSGDVTSKVRTVKALVNR